MTEKTYWDVVSRITGLIHEGNVRRVMIHWRSQSGR
jgi:hypothetical protein